MGKPKQRPRLSDGFAAEQKALRTMTAQTLNAASPPTTTTHPVQWLKKIKSGKIVKTGKSSKWQSQKSHLLTRDQILDATTTPKVPSSTATLSAKDGSGTFADAQSLIHSTRKQMKIQVRSKKARQWLKKEVFQKKVEIIKAVEKSRKEAKARQKTVIVGDMRPIFDALPSVPSLDSELQNLINQCQSTEVKQRTKRKLTMKRRHEEIARGLDYFATGLRASNSQDIHRINK